MIIKEEIMRLAGGGGYGRSWKWKGRVRGCRYRAHT